MCSYPLIDSQGVDTVYPIIQDEFRMRLERLKLGGQINDANQSVGVSRVVNRVESPGSRDTSGSAKYLYGG